MAESKLNEIIGTSLESIRAIADSNTVIGDPIETRSGTVIIPVSKISLGFASGGADYYPKEKKESEQPKTTTQTVKPQGGKLSSFAGGGGTGITITPVCFLVVKENGSVEILNIDSPVTNSPIVGVVDSVSSFLEGTPDLVARFKAAFANKNEKPEDGIDPESLKEEIADLD